MSLILNIDCATNTSLVQLVEEGGVLAAETNDQRSDHAAFLHPAIARILKKTERKTSDLKAVAVVSGPGSYTGIRIGMAAAKGLCLATGVPLILFNRLQLMAAAMKENFPIASGFYCPMIDARRMEVFCALYSYQLKQIKAPDAHILSTVSFREEVGESTMVVSGSGAEKFKNISVLSSLRLLPEPSLSNVFAIHSQAEFQAGNFAHLVDSQPFYAKDFYNG